MGVSSTPRFCRIHDDADIDVGAGPYVDMEDTAQEVRIGAEGTPGEWWDGDISMAWATRRDIGAGGAEKAARIMVKLLGL